MDGDVGGRYREVEPGHAAVWVGCSAVVLGAVCMYVSSRGGRPVCSLSTEMGCVEAALSAETKPAAE